MEKTCSKCKKEKDISQFSIDKKKKDGHSYVCKECHIIYMNSYYSKNKLRICKDTYKNKKRHRIEKKEKLLSYLNVHPCIDCGNTDVRVLEFDHIKGNKRMDVTKMVSHAYSWENIQKEIDKCEVVCSNCHKIRTYTRSGSYRNKKGSQ